MNKNNILDLPEILQNFLLSLEADQFSKNTVDAYYHDLKSWMTFLNMDKASIDKEYFSTLTINDLNLYINSLNASKSTINRKKCCLKTLFNYLQIENNIASNLKLSFIQPKVSAYLNRQESVKLIDSVKGNRRNTVRDIAILTLYLNTGIRRSELCDINMSDIQGDTLFIRHGKGDKFREIPLNQDCKKVVNEYLKTRKSNEQALFVSERGQRISPITVAGLVKKYAKVIGKNDITTHKLRHSTATRWMKDGVNLRVIQELLGQSSLEVVQIYTHVDNEAKKDAVSNSSLR